MKLKRMILMSAALICLSCFLSGCLTTSMETDGGLGTSTSRTIYGN